MKKALTLLLALCGAVSLSQAQDIKGDAAAGAKINAMCVGCHGLYRYQASFPEVYKVPMIAGQNAKYLAAALDEYKKGVRKFPSMRAVAATLTEQNIADLAAYYAKLGNAPAAPETPAAPSAEVGALLTKGACSSCHGTNFSKPIDEGYPKIAGQYPDYLYAALKAYKTEGNPHVGRGNPIMGAQVQQFSLAELKQIADYIGSLPAEVQTVSEPEFR